MSAQIERTSLTWQAVEEHLKAKEKELIDALIADVGNKESDKLRGQIEATRALLALGKDTTEEIVIPETTDTYGRGGQGAGP